MGCKVHGAAAWTRNIGIIELQACPAPGLVLMIVNPLTNNPHHSSGSLVFCILCCCALAECFVRNLMMGTVHYMLVA